MKIVQLGASIGNDHVTRLVQSQQNVEFLLLVEPNPKVQDKLRTCYEFAPFTIFETVAIVPDYSRGYETNMFFAEKDGHGGYQVTSLFREHLEKHQYIGDDIESFITKCTTLQDLFEKYNILDLDYLFIDIEGVDEEVLLNLDLNKYDVKNICIEVLHIKNPQRIYSFLQSYGYTDAGAVNEYDRMFVK